VTKGAPVAGIESLRASESRYRRLFETARDGILLLNADTGQIEDVNPYLIEMLGYTHAEFLGRKLWEVGTFADVPNSKEMFREVQVNGYVRYEDLPLRTRSGVRVDVEFVSNSYDCDGVKVIQCNIRDITERKQADDRIRRLSRVRAVLSGINGAIVRIRDRDELFREACRIAISAGEFVLARVVMLDAGGMARLAATTDADPRLFQSILDEYNLDPRHSESLIAVALGSAQPIVANDVASDPRIPNRAALTRLGNYALAVLPLVVDKRIVGAFMLRARDPGMFDEDEMRLLLEMAADMAFALDHIGKSERLDYLALYDVLTGLANRTLFLERLDQLVLAVGPSGTKVALVVADMERLRSVNDSLGRQAGDAVVRRLAERLEADAGKANVARIGADHFAVVFPAVKGRSEVTRRINALWQACLAEPFRTAGAELRMAAKAGVALFPGDGTGAELLLGNAEAALVEAKKSGERYVFFTPALTARTGAQLTLENRLRQALERSEFVLHYQPKVELRARRIVGVEALIRWQSPDLGLVPPAEFIPLLEDNGLILEVGAWALDQAIADHLRWTALGMAAPRVAVNVSAVQLRRRDFVDTLVAALAKGAVPPGIDLEITESLIMKDVDGSMRKLARIRDLGLSIAIDDFGTGYSSLGYLAKLPVQTLKIDRSFIVTMQKDPDTMTLVSTMISLAHSLRLRVVAEGVDEEEQARTLRLLRCDEMQGYLVSRPVPFEQMTAMLAPPARAGMADGAGGAGLVGGTGIEPVAPAV